MKILIVNVFGHSNRGDAMLLEALVDLLQTIFRRPTIFGAAFAPLQQERWMPEVAWSERVANSSSTIVGRLVQIFILVVSLAICATKNFYFLRWALPTRQRRSLEMMAEADIVISCPGGYLENSNKAYLINLLQIRLANTLCKNVILAPQSIGPIRGRISNFLVRGVLQGVKAIFPRERNSVDYVSKLNIKTEARDGRPTPEVKFSGDLAFWYSRKNLESVANEWVELGVDSNKKIIGITLVDWNFPGTTNPSMLRDLYKAAVLGFADFITLELKLQLVIFNQVSSDLKFTKEIFSNNRLIFVDEKERSCALFSEMIKQCEVFIGTRFHSCIFSLIGAVPTGAISYLPKTSGIMADIGLGSCVIEINEVSSEKLIDLYRYLEADGSRASKLVQLLVDDYKNNNAAFILYLQSIALNED